MSRSPVPLWFNGQIYRAVMRFTHRFHWHYAPPLYVEGDKLLWCEWCGFRAVVSRKNNKALIGKKS